MAKTAIGTSDTFPTTVLHCCALSCILGNGRRLYSLLKQQVRFASLSTNQAVGSSNLSGRAIIIRVLTGHIGNTLFCGHG